MKKNSGFTIIEVLVVVSIMGVLLSVVIANFGRNREQNVTYAKNNLVSTLHKIQSFSLSSRDISPGCPANSYQVVFNTVASNQTYTVAGTGNSTCSTPVTQETVRLPGGVYISNISVTRADNTVTLAPSSTVYFTVPYGKVAMIYSGGQDSTPTKEYNDIMTITLSTANGSLSANVYINGITGNVTAQ